MHNRFKVWENKLEDEPKKDDKPTLKDTKQNISRIEFKGNQPLEKVFEARVLLTERKITKGAQERRKLIPTFSAFGVGQGMESMRLNSNITMVQRDNIWHPYYEIKLDDEDLGTKFRKNAEQKKEKAVDGEAIVKIQAEIQMLENTQRAENEKKISEATGAKMPAKRTFDMKAFAEKKNADTSVTDVIKEEDPKSIKLINLNQGITEDDIRQAMSRFGTVVRVKIPEDAIRKKKLGFAIVGFEKEEYASRAMAEREVTVDMACLQVERALMIKRPNDRRDGGGFDAKTEFSNLTRKKN